MTLLLGLILGTFAPVMAQEDTPTEAPTEAPTEQATEAPIEQATEMPTEASTEVATEASTEAPTDTPTLAATSTLPKAAPPAQVLADGDMPCPGGYLQRITNGSFETPVMSDDGYEGVNSGVAGWYTISTNLLEWLRNWGGLPAAHGTHYTEVHTGSADTIYQTITTTPGETLNITFYHSARKDEFDNQMRVLAGPNTGSLTQLGDLVETDGEWVLYSRSYTVPNSHTSTVFAFEAVDPTGNAGNLVDGVSACEGDLYTPTPTPIPPSPTPTPVPAYMTCPTGYTQILANGSVEYPVVGGSWGHFNPTETNGWYSEVDVVEFLNNSEFMPGIAPPDGNQWMELNVYGPTMLWTNLTTAPGKQLLITFKHSSRGGGSNDEGMLLAGPDTANLVEIGIFSSGYGWESELFTYTVPDGQTTTYLAFDTITPEGNGGNGLDAMGVCEGVPAPTATPRRLRPTPA